MFFNEFRKIVQDYCRLNGLPFQPRKVYKELHKEYNASLYTAPVEDNDITAGQFLDSIPTERFMKPFELNFAVAECNAVCTFPVAKPCYPVPACEAPKKKATWGAKVCKQEQEVENTMTTYNEIEASRKYLSSRVQNVYYNKRDDLATQFRIYNSETPKTYKELIDAIKNDNFTLDTKRTARIDEFVDDGDWYGNALDGIKFNIPTAPDRDGYDAATKELDKQMTATRDIINVASPADGLKALQELEAWTPVGKAN